MIIKIVLTDSESNSNVLIYLNRLHGIPRNPYNVNHYTGGSSSGSAVAVAAGIPTSEIKNLFMFSVRISSYGCTREVWRAPKYVRVARSAAESNSSFWSALQTSQVHP